MSAIATSATITCPECGVASEAEMPSNACQFSWTGSACETVLRPLGGDCCVFCSYADRDCPYDDRDRPPRQAGDDCC